MSCVLGWLCRRSGSMRLSSTSSGGKCMAPTTPSSLPCPSIWPGPSSKRPDHSILSRSSHLCTQLGLRRILTDTFDSISSRIFQKMPKGGILHMHWDAILQPEWLVAYATYRPNCYFYTARCGTVGVKSMTAVSGMLGWRDG